MKATISTARIAGMLTPVLLVLASAFTRPEPIGSACVIAWQGGPSVSGTAGTATRLPAS